MIAASEVEGQALGRPPEPEHDSSSDASSDTFVVEDVHDASDLARVCADAGASEETLAIHNEAEPKVVNTTPIEPNVIVAVEA